MPNWLTGWVKMNSKHVVFAGGQQEMGDKSVRAKTTTPSHATASTASSLESPERFADSHHPKVLRHRTQLRYLDNNNNNNNNKSGPDRLPLVQLIQRKVGNDPTRSIGAMVDSPQAHVVSIPRKEILSETPQSGATIGATAKGTGATPSKTHFRQCSQETEGTSDSSANLGGGLMGFLPHPFFFNAGETHHHQEQDPCPSCLELESRLVAALDDLEYLRELALAAAHYDAEQPKQQQQQAKALVDVTRPTSSARLDVISKQLHESTTRHKKQVEQLTKERIRWQLEMHLKLSKFSSLCKDLNEESTILKHELTTIKEQFDRVQNERDALSEEVLMLRAKEAQHLRDKVRFNDLEKHLLHLEHQNLESQRAIQTRDEMLVELSSQLEQSLDLLDAADRAKQQHQRRNFFFAL